MDTHWTKSVSDYDKTDLTYLLARRLANTLERNSIRRFLKGENAAGPQENDETIYPIEMYIYPSTNPKFSAGDILKGNFLGKDGYWIIVTPSCDLDKGKVSHLILASCETLVDLPEFKKIYEALEKGQDVSKTAKDDLLDLIGNNRKGKNVQADRYHFLPGTFFLPDLVIDFQELVRVPLEEVKNEHRVTSLDSPFAESCLARFTRYYGRLGTPDIDKKFISDKIISAVQSKLKLKHE